MSGVAIVRALLAAHAPVASVVGLDVKGNVKVYAGVIPQNTPLPAIVVTSITESEQGTSARRLATKMIRERVQVTVLTKNDYPGMKNLLKAAALGPGMHTGVVLGYPVRSVQQWGVGPEIPAADDKIFEQSRDFMVTFIEAN